MFSGSRASTDQDLRHLFVTEGMTTARGEWQALRDDRPQTKVTELFDVSIYFPSVPESMGEWQEYCRPNLPWAEDHFQERVGGQPLNPGIEYQNWPWYKQGVEEHKESGKFSHTYMERMWAQPHQGYGNLNDVVELLSTRPLTRQAFLTIWWPKDVLQSLEGERVPCSLGYLFQMQSNRLDCYYYLRSCDFYRYLWDDMYMAGRLLQWIANEVNIADGFHLPIGGLHVKIANLHIFDYEYGRLKDEYQKERESRLFNALG